MPERLDTRRIISPADLPPSDPQLRVVGTFNPGVAQLDGQTVLLVRVVEQPIEQRPGFEASPWWNLDPQRLEIDWLDDNDMAFYDPRVFHHRPSGLQRLRFISHLRVVRSSDGIHIDDTGPSILPQNIYEEYGLEDPRITRIGDTFYITCVAVSRHGVSCTLMSTRDFRSFERHGIILPPENKDVLLFPERIDGSYMAIHRPVTSIRFTPPEMWIARSDDLLHWGRHEHLLGAEGVWQQSRVGGGTPPIRTANGWFMLYHGSYRPVGDPGVGRYVAGALMLDAHDPTHVLAQTTEPVIEPEADFEIDGFVPNVVFPTGLIERDDRMWVYYGAADEHVGLAVFERSDLLDALQHHTPI